MTIENSELTRQFPVLDTLRAVGAFAVLLTHVAFWSGAYTGHRVWGPLLARMDVGVAIFFVLSGFLLSRQWLLRAATGAPPPSIPRYLWKRVLRIYPVYAATAVLALAFIEANAGLGWRDWLVTLGLGDIYLRPTLPAGLTQMWSLATEVAFYLVLPVIMLAVLGRGRRLSTLRSVLVLIVMVALSVTWSVELAERIAGTEAAAAAQWLPGYLSWFAIGIGLAHLQVRHASGLAGPACGRVERVARHHPGVCWVATGALMLVASTPLAGPTLLVPPAGSEMVFKHLVYGAAGGLLVMTGVFAQPGSGYARRMSGRFVRHLGHISYGVFCIHLPVLHLVMWTTGYGLFRGHFLPILGLTLLVSVAAAEVLYRLIELPAMRLKRLSLRRAATTRAPDTVSSTR